MNPEITHIHLGPPGTGKTTKLISIVEKFLADGVSPKEICFVTFTKKAADVAMRRAMDKFSLTPGDLPYFRTLHSMAFGLLGLQRSQVMNFGSYIHIASLLGITISFKGQSDDGTFQGFQKGDRMFFMEGMARARLIPLKQQFDEGHIEDFEFREVEQIEGAIREYKKVHDKMDFTDMIIRATTALEEQPHMGIKKLVVDEAQDMSPCQWKFVEALALCAEEVHIAGDDDQAIFRWAGADVDHLINLKGNVHILGQSYRVPSVIAKLAGDIVEKIHNRRPKVWAPRPVEGKIEFTHGIDQVDMSLGTWLLLARNSHMLKRYEDYCTMQGYLFISPNVELLRGPAWECVRAWERMRAGKAIPVQDAVKVYEYMNVRERVTFGYKKKLLALEKSQPQGVVTLAELKESYGLITNAIWHEALDRLPAEDREYFLAALRRGEKMNQEPRIRISTIHGAKGGEADNVVIFVDMASKTFIEYQNNPDDEARVWYVAVTRAKETLYVIQPQSNRYFDI